MKKIIKALVVLITIFCLQAPAFAYDFGQYKPPETTPTGLIPIMDDANKFIRCFLQVKIPHFCKKQSF